MEADISSIQQLAQAGNTSPAKPAGTNQDLNMEDFFKLLTVQLTSQDPLKPMEDTEFISQMTGFSSLAEMEGMAEDMAVLREGQSSFNAQMLIGKEVTASTEEGGIINGVVTRIAREDGEMIPYVGDQRITMGSINEISNQAQL